MSQTVRNSVVRPASSAPNRLIRCFPYHWRICAYTSGIHTQILGVYICRQCMEYHFQRTIVPPLAKWIYTDCQGSSDFRQFLSLDSAMSDTIEYPLIILLRVTPLPCSCWRKQNFSPFPLPFC